MAVLSSKLLLNCLHSLESLPQDMMTNYKALHLRDIHFALPWHTLNMQWVSLVYLKSLVNDNCFQPEGIKPGVYSSSTAILLVFLSDEQHEGIQHVHIGLVVHCKKCNLYMQDRILSFVKSIEADLKKAWDRRAQNKDLWTSQRKGSCPACKDCISCNAPPNQCAHVFICPACCQLWGYHICPHQSSILPGAPHCV